MFPRLRMWRALNITGHSAWTEILHSLSNLRDIILFFLVCTVSVETFPRIDDPCAWALKQKENSQRTGVELC